MSELTRSDPKPMLPVAGRPILERLVLHLVGSGVTRIFLSVNYLADRIAEHFENGAEFGCTIEYLREDPDVPLGTGGPLRLLEDLIDQDTALLLVMNGDLVSSFSVSELLHTHVQTSASVTLALTEYGHTVPFGVATMDEQDPSRVVAIEEKPHWSGLINAGIDCLAPSLVSTIPPNVDFPMTELSAQCTSRGQRVTGWPMVAEWQDIGRPHELARARGQG